MKNNNIKQKIINEFAAIAANENPGADILENIHNRIKAAETAEHNKKPRRRFAKPVIAAATLVFLITPPPPRRRLY